MDRLTPSEVTAMFLGLGVLLGAARLCGEAALRLGQPAVIGEILAGIILGPTLIGRLLPGVHEMLFPATGGVAHLWHGFITLSISMFLLVAGMEVDLSMIWRQGRAAFLVGVGGLAAPFALGFGSAWVVPGVVGAEPGANPLLFALFFATSLAISSVPIIARTLMDMNLYRSELGMIIIAAAIFNDLVGWILFALVLGMLPDRDAHGPGIGHVIWMTLGFAALVLTLGRAVVNRIVPWLQAHTTWPGGVLSFALVAAFLAAAFTEWVGVHAMLGSFLVGVAIGDSPHLREHTRTIMHQFISFIFAPLFFASIGLHLDFARHFDGVLVVVVCVLAGAGKVIACSWGARLGGMARRESWAIGFGMNARGAMEIILGLLALQAGLIGERLFVALVIMALLTSMMSGPIMKRLLRRRSPRRFVDALSPRAFLADLAAPDLRGVVQEMAAAAAGACSLPPERIADAVLAREEAMSTAVGHGLALPHARLHGLAAPLVAVGLSRHGIDFDAPDGEPVRIIVMILTPVDDDGAQLQILADVARMFSAAPLREKAIAVTNYTQFLALVKTEPPAARPP